MSDIARMVTRARKGNQRALKFLYQRHVDAAWHLSFRILQRRDLAQDCTQDAFIKAFDSLERLDDPERFSGWLIRIVHRKALDLLRREQRHEAGQLEQEQAGGANNEDFLLRRRLMEAIETLDEEFRSVFVFSCLLGKTHGEIARTLNIPEGTSKRRLFEARRQLREQLEMVAGNE